MRCLASSSVATMGKLHVNPARRRRRKEGFSSFFCLGENAASKNGRRDDEEENVIISARKSSSSPALFLAALFGLTATSFVCVPRAALARFAYTPRWPPSIQSWLKVRAEDETCSSAARRLFSHSDWPRIRSRRVKRLLSLSRARRLAE